MNFKDDFIPINDAAGSVYYIKYKEITYMFYDEKASLLVISFGGSDDLHFSISIDDFVAAVEKHKLACNFDKRLQKQIKGNN